MSTTPHEGEAERAYVPFLRHSFGLFHWDTIVALKEYLVRARLIETVDSPIEVVMVKSIEHYWELVAEHGIPLARADYGA